MADKKDLQQEGEEMDENKKHIQGDTVNQEEGSASTITGSSKEMEGEISSSEESSGSINEDKLGENELAVSNTSQEPSGSTDKGKLEENKFASLDTSEDSSGSSKEQDYDPFVFPEPEVYRSSLNLIIKNKKEIEGSDKALSDIIFSLPAPVVNYFTQNNKVFERVLSIDTKEKADKEVARYYEFYSSQDSDSVAKKNNVEKKVSQDPFGIEDVIKFINHMYSLVESNNFDDLEKYLGGSGPVTDYIVSQSGLIEKVLAAKSKNEIDTIIDGIKKQGISYTANMEVNDRSLLFKDSVELTKENIGYLLKKWAWVEIEQNLGEGSSLKSTKGVVKEKTRYISRGGASILFTPGKDGGASKISFSLEGGIGSSLDKNNRDLVATSDSQGGGIDVKQGTSTSVMVICYDVLDLAKKQGFSEGFSITGGEGDLKRNLWALADINKIPCKGFSPKKEDQKWLDKRRFMLEQAFSLDKGLGATSKLGISSGAGVSTEGNGGSEID